MEHLLDALALRRVIRPGMPAYAHAREIMKKNEGRLKQVRERPAGELTFRHGDLPELFVMALVDPQVAAKLRGCAIEYEVTLAANWRDLLSLHPLWCPAYLRFVQCFRDANLLLDPIGSDTLDRLIRLKRDPVRAIILSLLSRDDAREQIRSYVDSVLPIRTEEFIAGPLKPVNSEGLSEIGRALAARALLLAILKHPEADHKAVTTIQVTVAEIRAKHGDDKWVAPGCRRRVFASGRSLGMWGLVHSLLDLGSRWSHYFGELVEHELGPSRVQLPADLSVPDIGGSIFAELCRDICDDVAEWYRSPPKTTTVPEVPHVAEMSGPVHQVEAAGVPVVGTVGDGHVRLPMEEALDRLLCEVDRHRLEFLFFADTMRIDPLLAQSGGQEAIRKSGLPGWKRMEENIDNEGGSLFRYRWVLEGFAQEAISRFGPGPGIPPRMMAFEEGRMKRVDVEGGSFPHWSIDEVGCPYLEESSDRILRACANVCALDPSRGYRALVEQVTDIAHDKDQSRWYPSILVRWEYLSELDEAISAIKKAQVRASGSESSTEEKRPAQGSTAVVDHDGGDDEPSPKGGVVEEPVAAVAQKGSLPADASAYVIDCGKMGLFCRGMSVPLSPVGWNFLFRLAYERGGIVPFHEKIGGEKGARKARAREGRKELGRCLGGAVARALVVTEKGRGYRLRIGEGGVKVKGLGEVGLV